MHTGHIDPPATLLADRINRLTVHWLQRLASGGPQVVSGTGVWPLLTALQLASADDTDMAGATGVDRGQARRLLAELLELLAASEAVHAALGVWAADGIEFNPRWLADLPQGVAGQLTGDIATDKATLDSWASGHTHGLVPTFPVDLAQKVHVILASALAVRTRWRSPFVDQPWHFPHGPWAGDVTWQGLTATSDDLVNLRVWNDGSTTLLVPGEDDVDVVLVMAPPADDPVEVLTAGIRNLTQPAEATPGDELRVGDTAAGVTVTEVPSRETRPHPWLQVTTVAFDVRAEHDLLRNAEVFGLESALRADTSPLTELTPPGDEPMVVGQASQRGVARFSATGFEAATVTAVAMARGAGLFPPDAGTRKLVSATFDRPFGYLALHRPTGLVVLAGWVDEPLRWPDERTGDRPVVSG